MMPLVDFEWEEEILDIEEVGPCFVAYAKDSTTGQWYRIAVALAELEEVANRKALRNEQRQH